jgi:anti-sigma factor RsiW
VSARDGIREAVRTRRAFFAGLAAGAAALALPSPLRACCVPISLGEEIVRARYVVEARVVSLDAHAAVLEVIAAWKGTPTPRLTVSFVRQTVALRTARPDTVLVVFAQGPNDAHLMVYPCGATSALVPELAAPLAAAGLTRTPR